MITQGIERVQGMKTVIHTVPGSGTRFVADILERVFGYRDTEHGDFYSSEDPRMYILVHAYAKGGHEAQHKKIDMVLDGVPFVTALRHPVHSYFTRNARPKREGAYFETPEQWADRWRTLIRVVGERRAYCFPVEEEIDRLRLIDRLGAHVKMQSNTVEQNDIVENWLPVGFQGPTNERLEYAVTGKVGGYDLMPLNFASDWYNHQVEVS